MIITEEVFTKHDVIIEKKNNKKQTMVLNGDPDASKAQSLIKLGNTDIKNVSEFKYQL